MPKNAGGTVCPVAGRAKVRSMAKVSSDDETNVFLISSPVGVSFADTAMSPALRA
jgi:hypothetical protein